MGTFHIVKQNDAENKRLYRTVELLQDCIKESTNYGNSFRSQYD